MTSMNVGFSMNAGGVFDAGGAGVGAGVGAGGAGEAPHVPLLASAIPQRTLAGSEQGQHPRRLGSSQADFSHASSHLGLAQLVGFTHLLKQDSSSHTGAHLGGGAAHVVWQWAGLQTDSHLGQPSFSQDSLGQRMVHTGFSQ